MRWLIGLPLAWVSVAAISMADGGHWSLKPLVRPEPPGGGEVSPVDAFVGDRLRRSGLTMSPPAEKRVWLRRVHFDLIGLPPSPWEMAAYLGDGSDLAEERVVDRLLASPRYGERWARHWMDVVRYAETHGHDEDAIREEAWPYRDWLIRAYNEDKPYEEFVREQLAGDTGAPGMGWAPEATGFLACGPWDGSSQMGIQDGTTDKKVAQYLDRDDMLSATMSAFTSTTVHCARCHDHKFDPVTLEDYYALQAVFAGVDKVERPFDADPEVGRRRGELMAAPGKWEAQKNDPAVLAEAAKWARGLERRAGQWEILAPEKVESEAGSPYTVQPDGSVLFGGEVPAKDTYTVTGRVGLKRVTGLRVEVLADATLPMNGPGRAENGNLHLSEIRVRIGGKAAKIGRARADFDQAGWEIGKAIDGDVDSAWGIHPEEGRGHWAEFVLAEPAGAGEGAEIAVELEQAHGRGHVIGRPRISVTGEEVVDGQVEMSGEVARMLGVPEGERTPEERGELALAYLKEEHGRALAALPEAGRVFAVASEFEAKGNFKPAGKAREVRVLKRGDIHSPGEVATAGALSSVPGLPGRFELGEGHGEGERRAALAEWLTHRENVLTWRSIVNRVWHYHFGRGIAATPNDFGKMGEGPTHPELLDWLAYEFRERGGSLKWLHKEIVLSATYRQASDDRPECEAVDGGNRLLWRMERRRLDAESIRDAVLALSGKLDLRMGGPSDRQFHTRKGVHVTPVVDYLGFDPDDPANFRRSVYRFVFRTVPDPLMRALDCPDASQPAPRREESATALQALAMLNNRFLVRQAEHLAEDLRRGGGELEDQVGELFLRAYGRQAGEEEGEKVVGYAREHGLENACRVIINSSEFVFVE